jgi:hypothetical protein
MGSVQAACFELLADGLGGTAPVAMAAISPSTGRMPASAESCPRYRRGRSRCGCATCSTTPPACPRLQSSSRRRTCPTRPRWTTSSFCTGCQSCRSLTRYLGGSWPGWTAKTARNPAAGTALALLTRYDDELLVSDIAMALHDRLLLG